MHLERNKLGDEAAAAIAKGFTNHNALMDLVLHDNVITDVGAAKIGEALEVTLALRCDPQP